MLACSDNICNTFSALHLNFLSTLVTPNCEREVIVVAPCFAAFLGDFFFRFLNGTRIY